MPYNVTIGAVDPGTSDAHFTTWRLFLQSSAPAITQQDWVVTFLDGEDHQAENGGTSFTQGNWQTKCIDLTVTSEGFTGIPYGQPGGSTSRLNFDFQGKDKIFFGSALGAIPGFGDVIFQDIEIRLGGISSGSGAVIKMAGTGSGHQFIFDRCVLSNFVCTGSNTQNIFWLDSNAGDGFKLTNVRVWDADFKNGNYCCVVRYNAYASSTGGFDVNGCEFVNLRGTGSDQDVFNSSNTAETAPDSYRVVKNCIFDTDGIGGAFDSQFSAPTYQTGNITSADGKIYEPGAEMVATGITGYEGTFTRGSDGYIDGTGTFVVDSTYATWYRPESTFWATYYWDSGASEWKYGLAMSDPSTWVAGSVSVLGTSSYTSSTKTVAGVNVPDDSRSTYPASDVWADPDNGDWTSAGASNPALLAGDRLSTDPASEYSVDIYGDPRDVSNADWDAGATAFTQVAPAPLSLFGLWVYDYSSMNLRTSGTPTVENPTTSLFGLWTFDYSAMTLRASGSPTVVVPQDGYNNPSDIVYTNPSGVAYNGAEVQQATTSILGLVRSTGTPSIANPPQNTTSAIEPILRTSGAPSVSGPDPVDTASAIEATLRTVGIPSVGNPIRMTTSMGDVVARSSGTPTVAIPEAVCVSCQSVGTLRSSGTPTASTPAASVTSTQRGTVRTSGIPSVGNPTRMTTSMGDVVARSSGTPTVTTPPGVTTSTIEPTLRSSGTPTVAAPASVCISCQSIGTLRSSGTPTVEILPRSVSSVIEPTLRTSGTPTTDAPPAPLPLDVDVEATLRTSGTPTVTAPLTSAVRGTLRTAGIPYVNTGWTNPRGERLFIVPQDFRHFVVPFENRNFEVI